MNRRVMSDWEWDEWAERGERIERTLYRFVVIAGFAALILANVVSLWLIASAIRDCADAAGGLLECVADR